MNSKQKDVTPSRGNECFAGLKKVQYIWVQQGGHNWIIPNAKEELCLFSNVLFRVLQSFVFWLSVNYAVCLV